MNKKIIDVRKILQASEQSASIAQQPPQSNQEYTYGRTLPYQGVILHTLREELLDPLTNNYPLALATIVNKPIVCYQVEYLLRHGIHDIQITVEKKFASKIERYLRNHFKDLNSQDNQSRTNIELVVFQEEEEPVTVLKAMSQRLQGDFIVIEGTSLIDICLDELLDTHLQCESTITVLMKEFDMSKGVKQADAESQDIFGVSTWSTEGYRQTQTMPKKACRIVLKAAKSDAQNGTINFKTSLMRK